MNPASKFLGFTCVVITIVLWAVTMTTDATPGPIGAAAALTAIVAVMILLTLWE